MKSYLNFFFAKLKKYKGSIFVLHNIYKKVNLDRQNSNRGPGATESTSINSYVSVLTNS